MELNDQVAVITGGDSGIDFASARLFLEAGADVVIMSNNRETLSAARSQLGAKTMEIEADVTDTKALHTAFAQVVPSVWPCRRSICQRWGGIPHSFGKHLQ